MKSKRSESYGYILGVENIIWEVPVVKYICEIRNENPRNVVWTSEIDLAQTWSFIDNEDINSDHVISHLQLWQNFIDEDKEGKLIAYKIRQLIEIVEEDIETKDADYITEKLKSGGLDIYSKDKEITDEYNRQHGYSKIIKNSKEKIIIK